MLRPLPTMMKIVRALIQWVTRTGHACRWMTSRGRRASLRAGVDSVSARSAGEVSSVIGVDYPVGVYFVAARVPLQQAAQKALAHQRSSQTPVTAPSAVAAAIPNVYQVATKAAACSGQCNPYSVAASAPETRPATAPVTIGRVGASLRTAAIRQV